MEILKKTNLSEAVSQSLLALISKGELEPGAKLPSEAQLCITLGVSRTAVREGIKALAGINVLTVFPGKGTFVNKNPGVMATGDVLKMALDKETINNLHEVRSILDAGIARCAVLKATETDIEALRKAVAKMEGALESAPVDMRLATEGDEEFHFALCEAAHNKLLADIAWPVINHAVLRSWKQMNTSFETVRSAVIGHRNIFDALEKKDLQQVLEATERHLNVAFEIVYNYKEGHSL